MLSRVIIAEVILMRLPVLNIRYMKRRNLGTLHTFHQHPPPSDECRSTPLPVSSDTVNLQRRVGLWGTWVLNFIVIRGHPVSSNQGGYSLAKMERVTNLMS